MFSLQITVMYKFCNTTVEIKSRIHVEHVEQISMLVVISVYNLPLFVSVFKQCCIPSCIIMNWVLKRFLCTLDDIWQYPTYALWCFFKYFSSSIVSLFLHFHGWTQIRSVQESIYSLLPLSETPSDLENQFELTIVWDNKN